MLTLAMRSRICPKFLARTSCQKKHGACGSIADRHSKSRRPRTLDAVFARTSSASDYVTIKKDESRVKAFALRTTTPNELLLQTIDAALAAYLNTDVEFYLLGLKAWLRGGSQSPQGVLVDAYKDFNKQRITLCRLPPPHFT
jgi:hypothetical protein